MFSPIYEWRTGFPWSAVNEFQDFVGPRNETGRLPTRLDARLHARPAAARSGSIGSPPASRSTTPFDTGDERDVQTNITSPDYGTFYNPIQRSIGFVFSVEQAVAL